MGSFLQRSEKILRYICIMERKNNPYLPIWFALILIGGILLGVVVARRNGGMVFRQSDEKLSRIMKYIHDNYVDTVSGAVLEEKAINGLLEKLDPHSVYITAEEFHEANDPLAGNFEGIGVQFRMERDTITVINPVPGGPSEKLGIRSGDRIVKIEGKNVAGVKMNTTEVMRRLKGPKGTEVDISIFRRGAGGLLNFTITRDVIPTYSMDIAYMVKPGIGYIRLNNFSATTHEEVYNALVQLKESGMKNLILDLRSNGGGYLNAAIEVAGEFLSGKTLIVYTEGMHHDKEVFRSEGNGIFERGKLVVMIDEGSASASEIVAGAVQDNDRGTIVGRRSFGKGLVQEQLNFKDGSALRLTVARYYTPTGRCIQRSYKDGLDAYNNDYMHRFLDGELENPDSIKFPDSLKYKTPGGKTVYGGGGIMPDLYIPIENDSSLRYYNICVNKGLVYQWAFDYTDRNRAHLQQYKDIDRFDRTFSINDGLYQEFIRYTETKGVKRPKGNLQKSDHYLRTLIKAYIARNILDNEGFYPILNTIDPAIQKAIEEANR